jgi:hypothetical protein
MSKPEEVLSPESFTGPGYQLGTSIAGALRREANFSLGVLLTLSETLGLSAEQLKAYKTLIKREMWKMMDDAQGSMYAALEDATVTEFNHQQGGEYFNRYSRLELELPKEEETV